MQDASLNEEFFQENFAECSKRVHPISFLQEYFQKSEPIFNKTLAAQSLIDLIESAVESPMDVDLIEELLDRIKLEKKKNLTLNEFFKVFHEAETVLLLKVEYMRFLLEQNQEIQQKIGHVVDDLKTARETGVKGGNNIARIEVLRLFGFKDQRSFIRIKYLDFQYETKLVLGDGSFKEVPFEFSLKSLDNYVEFQVFRLEKNKTDETLLGKTKLSLFFLNFSKKNEAKLTINPGMELSLSVEFEFPDKRRIISQMEAKIIELETENTRINQEKNAFKDQLGFLLKPFYKMFNPAEFYKFDQIPLETSKTLKIFEFMNPEEKENFAKKYPQEFPQGPKELNQVFEPKSVQEGERRKESWKEKSMNMVDFFFKFYIKSFFSRNFT